MNQAVAPIVIERKSEDEVRASMEELIRNHFRSIDELKGKIKTATEMVRDALESDAVYQEHNKAAEEASKKRSQTKGQIMMQQPNVRLLNEIDDMKVELREKKSALSDYLVEYHRMTQATQLDLFDGEVGEIILSGSLVKKVR